jgi:phage terminase large subunit-like protein
MKPFSVEHFVAYTRQIVLDTGGPWVIEDFQVAAIEPILAGYAETWTVLPEGNAKTTLMGGFALYHCDYTPTPWVPISAASRDQAEILARQAYAMIRSSPGMTARFKIFEGYREIRSVRNGGRGIKVYAADTMTADGVIPTLAICDEGHRYADLALYRLWRGKLQKRGGQIVMISTAGEPGGEFESTRDRIRDAAHIRKVVGAHGRYEGRGIVLNEWKVPSAAEITDMAKVKMANPLSTITLQSLQDDFESPTMDLGDWSRLKCNIPARGSNAAIVDTEWDNAYVGIEIPVGQPIDVGIDVAWKHDTFAIQPCWDAISWHGFRLLGPPEILSPPRDGSMLHPDEVKIAIQAMHDENQILTAVMDMGRAEDIAAWMEDELGITVIDREQGNAAMADDYEAFMRELREGRLKHNGHNGLRSHVMNAVARNLPNDKIRFDRRSQSRARRKQEVRVIDALTASAMVNWYQADQYLAAMAGKLAGQLEDYHILQL